MGAVTLDAWLHVHVVHPPKRQTHPLPGILISTTAYTLPSSASTAFISPSFSVLSFSRNARHSNFCCHGITVTSRCFAASLPLLLHPFCFCCQGWPFNFCCLRSSGRRSCRQAHTAGLTNSQGCQLSCAGMTLVVGGLHKHMVGHLGPMWAHVSVLCLYWLCWH